MVFDQMNKLYRWGAAEVKIPRALVLSVLLFVIILTIEAFARIKADRSVPIRYAPIPCMCDEKKSIYL